MKAIYKTSETLGHLSKVRDYCDGNWVCLIAPTPEEVKDVSMYYVRWTRTSGRAWMQTTTIP